MSPANPNTVNESAEETNLNNPVIPITSSKDEKDPSLQPLELSGAPATNQPLPQVPAKTSANSDHSARSRNSVHTTSTVRHNEIPFEQFKIQVQELCSILWPPSTQDFSKEVVKEPARDTFLKRVLGRSGNSFAKSIRMKGVSRKPLNVPSHPNVPSPLNALQSPKFLIERLGGGGFNRVVGITVINSDGKEESQLVLRVPRSDWQSSPDRDVAILRYVRHHTSISVADVKYFDFTQDNPLKAAYVVQSRIPGMDLQKAHLKGLSNEQWVDAAREIGKIMRDMQSVKSPFPGQIEASIKTDPRGCYVVRPFDVKSPTDKDWKEMHADDKPWPQEKVEYYYSDTFHFLATQFARWRILELEQDHHRILMTDNTKRLVTVADEMDTMGYLGENFGDNDNCLCHLDFQARNIMIDIRGDSSLTVTGILDWDSAVFAPRFVGCAPPHWMWADENDEDFDELDEGKASEEPKSENNRNIKKAWEEAVGPDLLKYAYSPHFRIARKLFNFALNGIHFSWESEAADKLVEEWDTLRHERRERIAALEAELADMDSDSDHYQETSESHEPGSSDMDE
ncbi:MAG: hypothetical protein Q9164_005286 [Protoblastenia rupestris]